MAEYENAVEEALLVEEEVVDEPEKQTGDAKARHFHQYLSFYITAISLVVAVAALMTALAADQSMDEMLSGLVDLVESNGLRVEMRCHEIQADLAAISGQPRDLQPLITDAAHKLNRMEQESRSLRTEAADRNHAHYVLAVGITLLQVATGLAATVGLTKKPRLLYPSAAFASGGVCLTVVGVLQYLT